MIGVSSRSRRAGRGMTGEAVGNLNFALLSWFLSHDVFGVSPWFFTFGASLWCSLIPPNRRSCRVYPVSFVIPYVQIIIWSWGQQTNQKFKKELVLFFNLFVSGGCTIYRVVRCPISCRGNMISSAADLHYMCLVCEVRYPSGE